MELSKKGIVFSGKIKDDIGMRMEGLKYESQIDAFLTFLKILHDLAKQRDRQILNAEGYAFISSPSENKRLKTIFNYIRDHFMESVALEDISAKVFMTPQSFCRFFKRSTNKTFTTFLNEYRINHATKLLLQTDDDVILFYWCLECACQNKHTYMNDHYRELYFQDRAWSYL